MATTMRQHQYGGMLKISNIVEVVLGIWLVICPFVLEFSDVTMAVWNSVLLGLAVVIFASIKTSEEGKKLNWPSWINLLIGIWLIMSPFMLQFSDNNRAYWNTLVLGVVLAILSIWNLGSMSKMDEN